MGKRRVRLWGAGERFINVDEDATAGATLGVDLKRADGSIVTEVELTAGSDSSGGTNNPSGVFKTLWRLILEVPQNIKDIVNGPWPTIRNSLLVTESFTILSGRQMIVIDEFDATGTLTIEGTLLVL